MSVSVRAQLLLTRQKLSMGLKATPSPTCSPSFPHSNRSYLTKVCASRVRHRSTHQSGSSLTAPPPRGPPGNGPSPLQDRCEESCYVSPKTSPKLPWKKQPLRLRLQACGLAAAALGVVAPRPGWRAASSGEKSGTSEPAVGLGPPRASLIGRAGRLPQCGLDRVVHVS